MSIAAVKVSVRFLHACIDTSLRSHMGHRLGRVTPDITGGIKIAVPGRGRRLGVVGLWRIQARCAEIASQTSDCVAWAGCPAAPIPVEPVWAQSLRRRRLSGRACGFLEVHKEVSILAAMILIMFLEMLFSACATWQPNTTNRILFGLVVVTPRRDSS